MIEIANDIVLKGKKQKKRILFLRNKAEKLLKTKDLVSKTNRKQTENKAGHVVENKRAAKNEPKKTTETLRGFSASAN